MAEGKPAGATALIIIDMINRLEFDSGEALRASAETIADRILCLRDEVSATGAPVIYVNDNHGDWLRDRDAIVAAGCEDDGRTRWALDIMAHSMKADIRPTAERSFADWVEAA